MTSDIIQAAIGALRASVEALPAEYRGPWHDDGPHTVVSAGSWPDYAFTVGAPIAGYIAKTASPHVVAALTEHLAAVQRHRQAIEDRTDPVTIAALYAIAWQTTVALAEAITHRRGT